MLRKIQRVVRCARRLRGNEDVDRKLLDELEEAVLFSYTRRCALGGLRWRLSRLLFMESEGLLFEFMLLWFIGGFIRGKVATQRLKVFRRLSANDQVIEVLQGSQLRAAKDILHSQFFINPKDGGEGVYKKLVDQNKEKLTERFPSVLRELAMFEEVHASVLPLPLQFNQVKLADPESGDLFALATTLKTQKELTLLCSPKPTLTHLENFQIALLHARLWLLHSDLPVCFGSLVTYRDLRSGCTSDLSFQSMLAERSKEQLPSVLETDHMLRTVFAHSRLKDKEEVYHMKEEDFSKSCRWKRPGHPVTITREEKERNITREEKERSMTFQSQQLGLVEDEDVRETVRAFEDQEPPRVLEQLRWFNANSFTRYSEKNYPLEKNYFMKL